MKKNIFFKFLFLACASFALLFSACRKETTADKVTKETLQNGTSFIGFPGGLEQPHFFDPFTTVKTVDVFALKRDAKSQADLKKNQNIVLTAMPSAIDDYNTENETEFELLPTSLYTVAGAGVTEAANGDLTFNMASGDFQKSFVISLDGSKWDLSKKYALAYKITDSAGLTVHAASRGVLLTFFSIKNKYDGEYHSTGVFSHPTAGDRAIDRDKTLTTAGPTSVSTEIGDIGGSMTLTIDETTNDVTVTGNVSATQPLEPTPGLTNTYDPATKTFHLNYRYLGGGGYRVIQEDIAHK